MHGICTRKHLPTVRRRKERAGIAREGLWKRLHPDSFNKVKFDVLVNHIVDSRGYVAFIDNATEMQLQR
jgi:hypothetical protein